MAGTRAVLVPSPNLGPDGKEAHYALGVLSLHRVLSDAGHDCSIYIPRLGPVTASHHTSPIRRWAADILAAGPDWVGLSTTCDSYPLVLKLARTIKQLAPPTRVVLGGPQASVVAEESMAAFPWIDYIVRGEAESILLDLARTMGASQKPEDVASLTYRVDGRIVSTPPSPFLVAVESLPLPRYETFPLYRQAALDQGARGGDKAIPLEAGRGCPHGCVFCSTSGYWLRRRRQKSPGLLAQQMRLLAQGYKVDAISLVQDLFAVDGAWLSDFLRAIQAGDPVEWGCSLRPDSVTVENLLNMRRAGCSHVFFGVETGSQRMQKLIKKNLDIPSAIRVVEAAINCGMQVITSFIVGFPFETRRDLQDTLALHSHFLSVGVEKSQVQMLCPLPKTQITMKYADQLKIDRVHADLVTGLEVLQDAEIDTMIRKYPHIFSSFYYVEPEFVSREELLVAVWAANALQTGSRTAVGAVSRPSGSL